MEFLIVLAILLVVASFITAPLRRAGILGTRGTSRGAGMRGAAAPGEGADSDAAIGRVATDDPAAREAQRVLAELEAARDAKYREIRDAELDYRTGKLSDEDYGQLDQSLRAEAIEILHQLDAALQRAAATIGER